MNAPTPDEQLAEFLARFTPEIEASAKAVLDRLGSMYPTADVLVYDNYNYLAVGFASGEKASDVLISIAVYPKWINLFLMNGAQLIDPGGLLKGSGSPVRHIRLNAPEDLDRHDIGLMMERALELAGHPFPESGKGRLIIKSISEKQLPRRPSTK